MTEYSLLRNQLAEVVPLNRHLGIEIISLADGVAEARLPFRREVTNHLGSMHATAMFGLAEAASGCAVAGAFAPVIMAIRAVATKASISFLKVCRSDLVAAAKTTRSSTELLEMLKSGRVVLDVDVKVYDARNGEVAQVVVTWHIASRKNRP